MRTLWALVLFVPGVAFAAGNAEKGKAAFLKHGCWQCHGYAAQGGTAGKKLAPDPLPLEAFKVFVRETRGPMPPYKSPILSDGDLEDVHAWLQSLPPVKDYRSIPLLRD